MMARADENLSFGISLWGQGEESHLIYSKRPISSINKLRKGLPKSSISHFERISKYYTPAHSWSTKWRKGNLRGISKVNHQNFRHYVHDHGLPDIIHAQASYPAAWLALELSEKYNIPYMVTLRMGPFPFKQYLNEQGGLTKGLENVLRKAQRLIATSDSLNSRAREFGLPNVQTINNPVDIASFCPNMSSTSRNTKKLLSVGRLEHQKGFDLLIEAVASLKGKVTFELEIVGEGSERNHLHRKVDELNLNNTITLTGRANRETVIEKMQNCDLYVLPSRNETFGNVLIEAMACGKPVVATRCGGPEGIVTSSTGLLCAPSDPESLAKSIEQALAIDWDPKKIRKHVEDNYSPELFTRRMKEVYKKVIDEHSQIANEDK